MSQISAVGTKVSVSKCCCYSQQTHESRDLLCMQSMTSGFRSVAREGRKQPKEYRYKHSKCVRFQDISSAILHHSGVIMSVISSQITSVSVVYWTVCWGADQIKHQWLRVTGLCEGNSPGRMNSPHKGPVTRKIFPFDDVIMWIITTGTNVFDVFSWENVCVGEHLWDVYSDGLFVTTIYTQNKQALCKKWNIFKKNF